MSFWLYNIALIIIVVGFSVSLGVDWLIIIFSIGVGHTFLPQDYTRSEKTLHPNSSAGTSIPLKQEDTNEFWLAKHWLLFTEALFVSLASIMTWILLFSLSKHYFPAFVSTGHKLLEITDLIGLIIIIVTSFWSRCIYKSHSQ